MGKDKQQLLTKEEMLDLFADTERSFTRDHKRQLLEAVFEKQAEALRLTLCAATALTADDTPELGGELVGLLTPHEAAEALGVQPGTIYRLRKEGRLPAVKVGRWLRFEPDDIRSYKVNRRVSGPPDTTAKDPWE